MHPNNSLQTRCTRFVHNCRQNTVWFLFSSFVALFSMLTSIYHLNQFRNECETNLPFNWFAPVIWFVVSLFYFFATTFDGIMSPIRRCKFVSWLFGKVFVFFINTIFRTFLLRSEINLLGSVCFWLVVDIFLRHEAYGFVFVSFLLDFTRFFCAHENHIFHIWRGFHHFRFVPFCFHLSNVFMRIVCQSVERIFGHTWTTDYIPIFSGKWWNVRSDYPVVVMELSATFSHFNNFRLVSIQKCFHCQHFPSHKFFSHNLCGVVLAGASFIECSILFLHCCVDLRLM